MSTDNTQEDYDENTSAGIFGNGLDRPAGECVEHLPKLPTTQRNAVLAIFNVTQSNP